MKLKIISLSLFFVVIFLSCKKEEQIIVENSGVPLLSQVMVDNQPYMEYLFTNANLVFEEKSKFDFTKHNYNNKNQLVLTDYFGNNDILSSDPQIYQNALNRKEWVTPENGTKVGTIIYEYNGNEQLIKTTYSRPLSSNSEYSEFLYDINNRISRQILYWENKKTGYTDYSYDVKGNLANESLYNLTSSGAPELISTEQYEYDNEHNPYISFSRLVKPGINTNINNIISETQTIYSGANPGTGIIQVNETSYAYNADGYPASRNSNVLYIYK